MKKFLGVDDYFTSCGSYWLNYIVVEGKYPHHPYAFMTKYLSEAGLTLEYKVYGELKLIKEYSNVAFLYLEENEPTESWDYETRETKKSNEVK